MMTERTMLQDVAPRDRVLTGAKNLLLKYALCNLVRQVAQEERNPGCQTCPYSCGGSLVPLSLDRLCLSCVWVPVQKHQ